MSRHIISLSHAQLTSFDLEAFMTHVAALHQHHREAFTTPFPKAPRRWLSHDHFTPRPLTLTQDGDVEGGLSWLVGATIDFSFTRSICAPNYGTRGGPCYDPASLVLLEVAAKVDQYAERIGIPKHFLRPRERTPWSPPAPSSPATPHPRLLPRAQRGAAAPPERSGARGRAA